MTFEARLQEIASLPDGWDGYGASHILPEVIAAVRAILTVTGDEGVDIFPTAPGGLQVDWAGFTVDVGEGPDGSTAVDFTHPAVIGHLVGDAEAIGATLAALLKVAT